MIGSDLGLEGLPNARDLGGHLTADAAVVRHAVLFRADSPSGATATDLALLDGLGVNLVIDLRGEAEALSFGPSLWQVERLHLPVCDTGRDILTALSGPGLSAGVAEQTMLSMYSAFVTDPVQRGHFATALRAIAQRKGSPVLFHCTAGKDRTGWLAAIVLSALGVDREAIIADYLLTNERFTTGRGAEGRHRLLAALSDLVPDVSLVLPLLEARVGYLNAAFDAATEHYGTMTAFLREGLGADIAQLTEHLTEPHRPAPAANAEQPG